MKTYFITGSSGFIGSNLAKRILNEEDNVLVIGLDNMNNYCLLYTSPSPRDA